MVYGMLIFQIRSWKQRLYLCTQCKLHHQLCNTVHHPSHPDNNYWVYSHWKHGLLKYNHLHCSTGPVQHLVWKRSWLEYYISLAIYSIITASIDKVHNSTVWPSDLRTQLFLEEVIQFKTSFLKPFHISYCTWWLSNAHSLYPDWLCRLVWLTYTLTSMLRPHETWCKQFSNIITLLVKH